MNTLIKRLLEGNKISKNAEKGGVAGLIAAISLWAGTELERRAGIPQTVGTTATAAILGAAYNLIKNGIKRMRKVNDA